jgi:hypothetical protein
MNKGFIIVKWTAISILCVVLFGWITKFLWNYVVPPLFNGPVIDFWRALALLLLSKLLLSGFGGRSWRGQSGMHWKHRYYDKLSHMTPEDRERFKARLREKWMCRSEEKPADASSSNSSTSNV